MILLNLSTDKIVKGNDCVCEFFSDLANLTQYKLDN